MDKLRELRGVAKRLMQEALGDSCTSYGVEAATVGTWRPREERHIAICGGRQLVIRHDEREAPMVVGGDATLVSFTDEGDAALCVWAVPAPGSSVAGIGVDLASCDDFAGERGATFNHLLFSAHEQEFVHAHYADEEERGFAAVFSAKEAAFKSLAAPLRSWYASHDEELTFEVREFELADATHARGTLRHAAAQAAMDAMGIAPIELHRRELDGAVLTLAIAQVTPD